MDKSKIFYRFNIPDKEILKNHQDLYDGISLSAHVAEYYNNSLVEFLKEVEKPYFIDPVTYVFARDLINIKKNGEIKRSYKKLIPKYGPSLSAILERSKVLHSDVNDVFLDELCKCVSDYQKTFLEKRSAMSKYDKILGKEEKKAREPLFLVPPYFYVESKDDPWYKISLDCAKKCKSLEEGRDVYPIIFISLEFLLDPDATSKILSDYTGFDGYIIWIADFNEKKANTGDLKLYRNLISKLSEQEKPIYSLYGGFFSILLSKFGLTGFSSGVCYGEKKNVDTLPGWAPPLRYYVPQLKTKAPEPSARDFYSDFEEEELLCNCEVCNKIKSDSDDSNLVADFFDRLKNEPKRNKIHFLINRKNESNYKTWDLSALVKHLDENHDYFFKELSSFEYTYFESDHLERWAQVLRTAM